MEAMALSDRIVVMNRGAIEQVGPPEAAYQTPASHFVAGFLGTPKMGFLNGRASRVEASGCEVELDAGCRLFLPVSGATLKAGDPVTLGIRPEHLNRGSEGNCQLTVKADVSERLGSDTYCHVVTGNGEQLTMRIRGDFTPRYGESLSLISMELDGTLLTRGDAPSGKWKCGVAVTVLANVAVCVEIKVLRRVRAESSRRPRRHRRDACSMA